MSICHSDMLNDLSTKFYARRSDIIISSTMSITLTPVENYVLTSFSTMTTEEIDQWVQVRSNYRANQQEEYFKESLSFSKSSQVSHYETSNIDQA